MPPIIGKPAGLPIFLPAVADPAMIVGGGLAGPAILVGEGLVSATGPDIAGADTVGSDVGSNVSKLESSLGACAFDSFVSSSVLRNVDGQKTAFMVLVVCYESTKLTDAFAVDFLS